VGIFVLLDEFLINKFQKLSDWLTKLIGVGGVNYKLAYFTLTSYVVVDIFADFIRGFQWFNVIGVAITLWIGIMYKNLYDMKERIEDQVAESKAVDGMSRDIIWRLLRLGFVMFFPVIGIMLLFQTPGKDITYDYYVYHSARVISDYCFAISLYFFACHKLPPCRGKAREWLESFGHSPAEAKVQD